MRRVLVYGPAYLDHVVRVDRPLLEGHTFDGSCDGRIDGRDPRPAIRDRSGREILLRGLRDSRSRPFGRVDVDAEFPGGLPSPVRTVDVMAETRDLGGMGAGYASAFGGELVSALGPEGDAIADRVAELLAEAGIAHRPIRVPDRGSDWTMIVSSGGFGDKLAIGFRGCHAAVDRIAIDQRPSDLLVIAALPNRLIAQALEAPAAVRFLAPARRNMAGGDPPLASLAGRFDILSCNRGEWEAAEGRHTILEKTPIVVVTDGPAGCLIHHRSEEGSAKMALPAFPRDAPPRDTNRAGEAFAGAFVTALIEAGWRPGPADSSLVRSAGLRGLAAAALVLDREDFGFPTAREIDLALRAGRVAGGAGRPTG